MELRNLGKTGIKISPLIFGSWVTGGALWGGVDDRESIEAIQTALDHGMNMIDTAPVYGIGHSEEIVAKAIKGRRDKVVIATKCGMCWDSDEGCDPWSTTDEKGNPFTVMKNSRSQSIIDGCEGSLKRLGVDVIDLLQIHWPDRTTPIEESWNAMASLKKQGKVRAIGVSNYNLEQLQKAHQIHPIDSLQPPYSLARRGIEKDLIPFCQENQIAILAYSPLERGLLTGKITPSYEFGKGDHRNGHRFFSRENRTLVAKALENLQPLLQKYKVTLSQLVLATTIRQPGITTAIVAARTPQQAKENSAVLKLQISKEDFNVVDEAFNFRIEN